MARHLAVVWLDHRRARVIRFGTDGCDTTVVTASAPNHLAPNQHHAHQAGFRDGRRTPVDHGYYASVVAALGETKAWLIMGPGQAKLELVDHVEAWAARLSERVAGLETADHPTDGQILARARDFFKAADHMTPRRG